nr:hypothetical protein [Tanacetum cinerariifolium]
VVEKEKSFKQRRIIVEIDEDVEINLEEAQAKLYRIDLEHPRKVLSMQDVDDEEPAKVEEVLEVVIAANLMTEVVTTAGATTTAEATKAKQKEDGIFISQDKYVAEILKKFDFLSVKTASTLIETQKPLVKDKEAAYVNVTPKTSHLQAVKRIIRYLKGQPKLGLWYPKVSSFDLKAYSDSDYAGANLDRKSTTGGCQFLARRLISWQCKNQTIMATSTTEAEYVAAAH